MWLIKILKPRARGMCLGIPFQVTNPAPFPQTALEWGRPEPSASFTWNARSKAFQNSVINEVNVFLKSSHPLLGGRSLEFHSCNLRLVDCFISLDVKLVSFFKKTDTIQIVPVNGVLCDVSIHAYIIQRSTQIKPNISFFVNYV